MKSTVDQSSNSSLKTQANEQQLTNSRQCVDFEFSAIDSQNSRIVPDSLTSSPEQHIANVERNSDLVTHSLEPLQENDLSSGKEIPKIETFENLNLFFDEVCIFLCNKYRVYAHTKYYAHMLMILHDPQVCIVWNCVDVIIPCLE